MPRWLWITLGSLLILLAWLGLDSSKPVQVTGMGPGTQNYCPPPTKFRRVDKPLQSDLDNRIAELQLGESKLIPLAGFSLQARVLAREDYHFDAGAEFSPTDLALGWGPMSEQGLADKLNISQSGRWYRYSWNSGGPPIPLEDIINHSANMHMVPANPAVAKSLKGVSENDVVELDGWLVRIEKNDGWRWQSSLSRNDSGDGSCELIYVCSIEVKK
jgi:hypothetical protein